MTNFDTARDALETSLNSAGSAMAEHEKWQQSLEAQINKLKASWQGLSQAFLKSDFLHAALDAVIGLVDGLTKLIDTFGALPTILGTVAAGFSLFKNKGLFTFDKSAQSIQLFGNNLLGLKDKYNQLQTAISRYNSLSTKSASFQEKYNKSMANSSSHLGKYLSGLNGAKASFGGYISSLIGAKIKTVALEAATMALNAVITMGVSFIISGLVSAIQKWINAEEELAEKVDEVTSKFKEQQGELVKGKSSFETESTRYAKLSKGVDNLGRNVSLTAEEYSEYQSIVNSIADQIPSLISGYDSQGNAILNVKDNVEDLVAAYEKLIKAQNNEVLRNTKDIEDDFGNVVKDSNKNKHGFLWLEDKISAEEIKQLQQLLNGDYSSIENKAYDSYNWSLIAEAIKDAGGDVSGYDVSVGVRNSSYDVDAVKQLVNANRGAIKSVVDGFYSDLEAETEGMKSIVQAKLSNAFDISDSEYYGMSDTLKNVAKQIANGFDYEFFASFEEGGSREGSSVQEYIDNMLDQLNAIGKQENKQIEAALNLKTKFNNDEISYGEFVDGLEDAGKLIDNLNLTDDIKAQLKLSLGLDKNGLVKEYRNLVSRLSDHTNYDFDPRIQGSVAEEFLNSLSSDELSVAIDVIAKLSNNGVNETVQDIRKAIEREMAMQGLSFDLNLEVEAAGIESLNTALQESVSATGLSSESISALKSRYSDLESEGYDLSAMFEETSNGIHLNKKALGELEQAYAKQKKADIDEDLKELQTQYELVTKDIESCNDASDRAALYVQRDSILQQINDAATLAAQYEGLASSYNDWLAAEEAGQERDMYEKLIEGLENVDDEISRGWLDDGTIEFLELLTGKDLTTAPIEDLKQAYKNLDKEIGKSGYSIRDFFTVNEDGDSTNTGVYNFLETIESLGGKYKEAIKKNGDRIVGFDFKVAGGDEAIAEALGISEELVQIMVRAADDAGFVVNIEGAYTQLADLKTEAETARDTLISLKKDGLDKLKDFDVSFNLDADGNELVEEQAKAVELLNKFKKDGKIDITMDGAQEALDIAEYLTIRLDDLTEPRYMQVDTSSLEDDLQEPIEKMQEFEKLTKEKHLLTLTGDTEGLEEVETKMSEIAQYLDSIEDEETQVKLGIKGLSKEEIEEKLEKGEIELNAELNLDVQMSDDLRDMRLMMMNQLGLASDNEVKLKIGYDIDDSVVEELTEEEKEVVVKYIADHKEVEDWSPEAKNAFVKYLVDGGDPEKFDPDDKDSWVVYNVNDSKPKGYEADDKNAEVNYGVNDEEVRGFDPPDIFRKVYYTIVETIQKISSGGKKKAAQRTGADLDGSGVNGTANVNGTTGRAFKQGSWGTKNSGTALVGELGRETLVRDGKYYTIGDTGAEFIKYQRGDIVFNHKQTDELFKNGKVTSSGGRGKALASGTAFGAGSFGSGGLGKIVTTTMIEDGAKSIKTKTETEAESGSKADGEGLDISDDEKAVDDTSKLSSSTKEFEETFDWIEIAISRLERAIDNLGKKANNVYKSWSDRNSALSEEIGKVGEEIKLQEDAAQRYLQEANSVGLSSSYAEMVRNGTIDIENFKGEGDEALVEKIKDYQTWYEKYLACTDAAEELRETESKLYAQRFENIQTQYDAILQGYEHTEAMLNEYISQAEERGHIVSKKYYEALIENEQSNIDELRREQADLIAERDNAVAAGKIVEGSEAWYEQCVAIDEVTQAIEESTTALLEYDNAIRDIDWQIFDLIQERISDVTEEADFLIELMSNKKLFEDDGKLTSQGLATMALHGQNYNSHMYAADTYGENIDYLDKQIANDPYDQELINRRNELLELQRESILAAEDEKNAVRDMVEEGINLELDALQELIDKKNEELESERDLYEYQKKVKEQTEEIASLEKQMSAYSGDDSEEAKQKIQQIKVDLETARQDLQETEYDKFISDTSSLLDTLYTEYEFILNTRLDNIDALLTQVIDSINAAASADGNIAMALGSEGAISIAIGNNAISIKDTLTSEANKVGTTLSSAMNSIWNTGDGNAKSVLTMYGDDFKAKSATVITTLNGIKAGVNNMMSSLNKDAQAKVETPKTQPSSVANPTNGKKVNPPKPSSTGNTKPSGGGDGVPKIGDKVTFVKGQYYYDSQGTKPLGSQCTGEEVYITNINTKSWATHPYHIARDKWGSRPLGWLKKEQISGYAVGKKDFLGDEIAWTQENGKEFIVRPSDGAILTPVAKGDSILTSAASSNIWNMANNPAEFIRDNLNFGDANVPNNSNVNNSYVQHFENVTFSMPNVHGYSELLTEMQKDKNFEKLILSMTIDRINGKSSLAKGKSIR